MNELTKKKQDNFSLPKSRIIVLGEIETEHANEVIQSILELNEDDNHKRGTKKPIKLIINSPGGDVYSALGIIDVILNSTTPIHTICYGKAMSAAFVIFLCGAKRIAGKNSTFMYHDISWSSIGDSTLIRRELEEGQRTVEIIDNIIINNSALDKTILDDIKYRREDKYFNINEAYELRMVDEIL